MRPVDVQGLAAAHPGAHRARESDPVRTLQAQVRAARFRTALGRRSDGPAVEEGGAGSVGSALAAPVARPPWSRPEGPPGPPARPALPPLPATGGHHRVLIGRGPAGAEARLTIASGPLAGVEIHLREGAAGLHASLLTRTASSRQTLAMAMEEVAQRLKRKGHVLRVGFGEPPTAASHWPPTRGAQR